MTQEECIELYFFKKWERSFGGVLRLEIVLLSPIAKEIFKNLICYNYHGGEKTVFYRLSMLRHIYQSLHR